MKLAIKENSIISSAAVFTAASRLIPFPFLDDIVEDRVRLFMLSALLKQHGVSLPSKELRPIYNKDTGCIAGALGFGVNLLLKPLRKIFRTIFFILTIRDVSLHVADTILLGRAIDRILADKTPKKLSLTNDIEKIREAFLTASTHVDRKLAKHLFDSLWDQRKHFKKLGSFTRKAFAKERTEEIHLDGDQQTTIDQDVQIINEALDDDRSKDFLAKFDAKFDEIILA